MLQVLQLLKWRLKSSVASVDSTNFRKVLEVLLLPPEIGSSPFRNWLTGGEMYDANEAVVKLMDAMKLEANFQQEFRVRVCRANAELFSCK